MIIYYLTFYITTIHLYLVHGSISYIDLDHNLQGQTNTWPAANACSDSEHIPAKV